MKSFQDFVQISVVTLFAAMSFANAAPAIAGTNKIGNGFGMGAPAMSWGITPNRHVKINAPWLGLECIGWLDGRCGGFGINPQYNIGLPTDPVTGQPMWPPMMGISAQPVFGIPGTPSCAMSGGACWSLSGHRAPTAPILFPVLVPYPALVPQF